VARSKPEHGAGERDVALGRLRQSLADVGFALPGSVVVRSYRCGKANCACHAEPPRLHGPYIQWSRTVGGKTLHRRMSEEQLADYQEYFDNARKLKALVAEIEALALTIVEEDARWPRR